MTFRINFDGAILVYDVTDRASFEDLAHDLHEVEATENGRNCCKMIWGTKVDLRPDFDSSSDNSQKSRSSSFESRTLDNNHNHAYVTYEEGLQWADDNALMFAETSARTGMNVKESFDVFIKSVITTVIKNWA